jgi:hypothetical protein
MPFHYRQPILLTPLWLLLRSESLGETGGRMLNPNGSIGLPYDLREGIARDKSSFFMLGYCRCTDGARESPFGVVRVDTGKMNATSANSSVIYIGEPARARLTCLWEDSSVRAIDWRFGQRKGIKPLSPWRTLL